MSYINDALRKAQQENKPSYSVFGPVVAAPVEPPKTYSPVLSIAGILLVFVFAAGMIALMYWPWAEPAKTPAAAVAGAEAPAAASADSSLPQAALSEPGLSAPEKPAAAESAESAAPPAQTAARPPADRKAAPPAPARTLSSAAPKARQPDAETLYAKALGLHQNRKYDDAERLYKQILQTDPRHLAAINNLGVICMTRKKYPQAIGYFEDALAIRHDYVKAHYNLACVYARQNDVSRSLFYLKNAMDFNPDVRLWVADDQDLKAVAALPEYKQMSEGRNE